MIDILEEVGLPAVLEQLAEECCELAHAALKLARVIRAENPTPITDKEALDRVNEEFVDVLVVWEVLGGNQTEAMADDPRLQPKLKRWIERIEAAQNGQA